MLRHIFVAINQVGVKFSEQIRSWLTLELDSVYSVSMTLFLPLILIPNNKSRKPS